MEALNCHECSISNTLNLKTILNFVSTIVLLSKPLFITQSSLQAILVHQYRVNFNLILSAEFEQFL